MQKVAIVGAIIEDPASHQQAFNEIVSSYKGFVRGRLGLPFDEARLAVIALVVCGSMDEINSFTGKLGKIPSVSVKTTISQTTIEQ